MTHARQERPHAHVVLRLPGEGQRSVRSAVKAVVRRDDLDALGVSVLVLGAARELDHRLVRLGAAVREVHAIEGRPRDDLPGELDGALVVEEVRRVHEPRGLLRDRRGELRMGVPDREHRDAARQVEVAVPLDVRDATPRPARQHERRRPIVPEHHPAGGLDELLVGRHEADLLHHAGRAGTGMAQVRGCKDAGLAPGRSRGRVRR